MNTTRLSVFPGQGTQFVGMGKELFEKYPYHVELADEILGYSITELCLNDTNQKIHQTQYTQPALFFVNILHYIDSISSTNEVPDILAGHSLGEYCALFAAGAISFNTALQIVIERGRLMSLCDEGTMTAITGINFDEIEEFLKNNDTSVEIANINSRTQVVLAGKKENLEYLKPIIDKLGGRWHWLQVGGAFHSSAMKSVANEFRQYLDKCTLYPLKIPVISNTTATNHEMNNPEIVKNLLAEQLYHPVNWYKSLKGINTTKIFLTEHGPKEILRKLSAETIHLQG